MTIVWLFIFIALLAIELATVNLVTIWFAIGALASFGLSFFLDSLFWQIFLFVVVSSISLLLTRKIVEKIRGGEITPTNLDMVIGKIGIVTEEINKLEPGEVKVDGKRWSAIANKKISVDSKVEILAIDGVKLKVKEVKEEN